jgi:hypothetical protein
MGTYEVRPSVGLDFRTGASCGGGLRDSLLDHGSPPDFLQRVWPGADDEIREDSGLGLRDRAGDDSKGREGRGEWCEVQGLNLRPLECESSALPLS